MCVCVCVCVCVQYVDFFYILYTWPCTIYVYMCMYIHYHVPVDIQNNHYEDMYLNLILFLENCVKCVCACVHVTDGATLLLNVRNVTERLPLITSQRHSICLPLTRRLHISSVSSLRYTTCADSPCFSRCVQRLSVRTASTDRQQHPRGQYGLLAELTASPYICVPPRTCWTTETRVRFPAAARAC